MKQIAYFILLSICVMFSDCQKQVISDQDKQTIKINTAKLYGKWNFVSLLRGGVLTTNSDPCNADNLLAFYQDLSGTISQGLCIENPPIHQNVDFHWKFISPTMISLDGDEITLVTLNDSLLHFVLTKNPYGITNDDFQWKK